MKKENICPICNERKKVSIFNNIPCGTAFKYSKLWYIKINSDTAYQLSGKYCRGNIRSFKPRQRLTHLITDEILTMLLNEMND